MPELPFTTFSRGSLAPGVSGRGTGLGRSATIGSGFNPQPRGSRPATGNINVGTSNADGYTLGRGLSTTEIAINRSRRPNASYADGRPVPTGMRINVPGWNTSGVGPGTPGYRGSYRYGGYNFGGGTGRPSSPTAADYYRNRGSSLDRFGNNAQTNRADSWMGVDGFRQYGGPVRRGGRYLVGEDGPEVVVMPQEGYVIPNPRSRRAPSFRNSDEYYAYRDQTMGNPLDRGARKWGSPTVRDIGPGFEDASAWAGSGTGGNEWFDEEDMTFGHSAVDRLAGAAEPYDGEVREGRDGRMWRYDARLGRGVPVSVYEGDNLYAPSPPVELMTPDERYQDIGMRLQALRDEAGRQFQDRRRFEESKFVQPAVQGRNAGPTPEGGLALSGRYGRGTRNIGPVAESYTVDLEDGTQGRYSTLGDAARESAAASASRRMRSARAESARRLGY